MELDQGHGRGGIEGSSMKIIDCEQLRQMFQLNSDGSLTWLSISKYHIEKLGRAAGSPIPSHGKAYWAVQINGRKVKRSRIVFCLTHGRWPQQQIDHINGNSLDDRPENLREATVTQNAWNHKRRAKRSPTPMGVRFERSGRYRARIAVNKKQLNLGVFATMDMASDAYQAARRQHFGEFA